MGERCYGRHGRCYVLNIRWNLDQLQPYTILLSLVSRVDVSPECALSRIVCAVLSSVTQRCIFIYVLVVLIYILYKICI